MARALQPIGHDGMKVRHNVLWPGESRTKTNSETTMSLTSVSTKPSIS